METERARHCHEPQCIIASQCTRISQANCLSYPCTYIIICCIYFELYSELLLLVDIDSLVWTWECSNIPDGNSCRLQILQGNAKNTLYIWPACSWREMSACRQFSKFIHFLRSSFHFTLLPFGIIQRKLGITFIGGKTTGIQHAKPPLLLLALVDKSRVLPLLSGLPNIWRLVRVGKSSEKNESLTGLAKHASHSPTTVAMLDWIPQWLQINFRLDVRLASHFVTSLCVRSIAYQVVYISRSVNYNFWSEYYSSCNV